MAGEIRNQGKTKETDDGVDRGGPGKVEVGRGKKGRRKGPRSVWNLLKINFTSVTRRNQEKRIPNCSGKRSQRN